MSARVTIDPSFNARIGRWAALKGIEIPEAFKVQAKLLCHELIQRTPPFAGKSIVKMLGAQGKVLRETDIEDLSAKKVGERRVEKDIRRVVYGVNGAQLVGDKSKHPNWTDWGVLQRCEDKQAVRIFATKSGEVYGVDTAQWAPQASNEDLAKHHNANRTKRGRVTTAGARTRNVGRWRWLDVIVTKEQRVKSYIREKLKMVGQAKGGWAAGFMKLGGRMSMRGWIGRHSDAGECRAQFGKYQASIEIINRSRWATSGDPDRIIAASLAGRDRALKANIEGILKKNW